VWPAALASLHAELGAPDDARRHLASAVGRISTIAQAETWPAVPAFLAETVIELGDVSFAPAIAPLLAAFEGQNLFAGAELCAGPADRLLAGLAALSGRSADAEARFRAAYDLAERSRSPLWRVRVELDWARVLARHDLPRARELATRAGRDAVAIGAPALANPPAHGASPRPPAIADRGPLSPRELDVLRLVAVGCSNREIGVRLFISSNTAANHVRAILQKTGCVNRAQAVAYAARRHLLDELA
jgi:DNA-binding CsgD family transcriptional regulator